jgi:cellobiose phosphorylase
VFPAQHVDAGVFAWEFLWEYLCQTRDFAVLQLPLRWLDQRKKTTVLDHVLRLFDYYLSPRNLGPHGLCKIRGGDWNDSVNLAGLEGKGETVMVSCQLVLALQQAARLFGRSGIPARHRRGEPKSRASMPDLPALAKKFSAAARKMRDNLQRHAFNKSGFFNGVFSDSGKWVFSSADSDGKERINGPANSFAVIAGVARGPARESVFDALNRLKGPHGWRLFSPAIGHPPIPKLGRIGQGDLEAGIAENGAPYNHGSHGFLGRAAWTAGRGQMFYDVMRYMLPYDQQAHPIAVSKTAPYGVVNHWKEAIGMEGRGGDTFLSGSIATALRNFYEGMAGFRPELEAVVIDPVIPPDWRQLQAHVSFMGAAITINVRNPNGKECGIAKLTMDGKEMKERIDCPRLERQLAVIPIDAFKKGKRHTIEVTLG